MRERKAIEANVEFHRERVVDPERYVGFAMSELQLEVLLDIRELLQLQTNDRIRELSEKAVSDMFKAVGIA